MASNDEPVSATGHGGISPQVAEEATIQMLLARVQRLESEAVITQTLKDLDTKLELLMQMVCPVCGPKLHKVNHPEIEAEIKSVAAAVSRNGHSHNPDGS